MRQIIESAHFSECVEQLGGYRAIDEAMDPIIESLYNNPYGFKLIQNDFTSFRFAMTDAIGGRIAPLVVAFTIDDNKDVVLEWIEEVDEAEF